MASTYWPLKSLTTAHGIRCALHWPGCTPAHSSAPYLELFTANIHDLHSYLSANHFRTSLIQTKDFQHCLIFKKRFWVFIYRIRLEKLQLKFTSALEKFVNTLVKWAKLQCSKRVVSNNLKSRCQLWSQIYQYASWEEETVSYSSYYDSRKVWVDNIERFPDANTFPVILVYLILHFSCFSTEVGIFVRSRFPWLIF